MKKKLYQITMLLFSVLGASHATDFNWVSRADIPTSRGTAGSAVVNGKIYVIGGANPSAVATVEEYNPALNSWASKANMPTARSGLVCSVVNDKIYAIGGSEGMKTVEMYNPSNNTWTTKRNMLVSRRWHASAVYNNKIYVFGGDGGGVLNSVEEYDTILDTWTLKASMPTGRYGLSAVIMNNKIYLIGGSPSTQKIEEYDPAIDSWSVKSNLLNGRSFHSAFSYNNELFVVGGYTSLSLYNLVEQYDATMDTWTISASISIGRTHLTSQVVNDKVYVISGYEYSPLGYTSSVEEGSIIEFNSISGYIQNSSSIAIQGVSVSLSGSSTSATVTNISGFYQFNNLPNSANYTITPSKTDYSFLPLNKEFSNLSTDQINQNFIGIDLSSPSQVVSLNDGSGTDIDFTTSTTELSANWDQSTDPESGILRYWYAIGTTLGATDLVTWTNNGTSLNITKTELTLTVGTTYYFTVKAENTIGLMSITTNSDGLYINTTTDDTPPIAIGSGNVRDGSGTDIDFTTSTTELSANWDQSTDPESGILRYWYAIGTTLGATDLVTWTNNGTSLNITKTELTLTVGTTYYFTVKAENTIGLMSITTNSDGLYVKLPESNSGSGNGYITPPVAIGGGNVRDGLALDIDFTTSTTELSANWDQSTDPESGILRYWYAIGTTPGDNDLVNWTSVGNSLTVTKTNLTLIVGTTYYFTVKAENSIGLLGTATNTDGLFIKLLPLDLPPTITIITPGNRQAIMGNLNVKAEATDDFGITKVEFLVDGTCKNTKVVGPYHWIWDTTCEIDGDHILKVVAFDTSGQTATTEVSVTIHQKPAEVDIIGELRPIEPIVEPGTGKKAKIKFVVDLPSDKKQQEGSQAKVRVRITIHTLRGSLVKTLLDEDMALGEYQQFWDGKNFAEEVTASGVYIVKIQAGDFRDMKKIIVVK